jgi:hypothetical protein
MLRGNDPRLWGEWEHHQNEEDRAVAARMLQLEEALRDLQRRVEAIEAEASRRRSPVWPRTLRDVK